MGKLSRNGAARVEACCAELYRWEGNRPFAEHVVRVLAKLVDAPVLAYQWFDLQRQRSELVLSDRQREIEANVEAFYAHVHQHPLIMRASRGGVGAAGEALRISDLQPWPQFQMTGLYNEFYARVKLGHQMAVSLPTRPGEVLGVAFSRDLDAPDFTQEERRRLEALGVHLVQAQRIAHRMEAMRQRLRQMQGMLEELEEGVLALDGQLRVRVANRGAARLLRRHFGEGRGHELPHELRAWVMRQLAGGTAEVRWMERLRTCAGILRVTLGAVHSAGREGSEWVLVLEEKLKLEAGATCQRLRALGLTPREAEVLHWISLGKLNNEIAVILGSRTRTVQKHVEHILRKLNVENRQAAAVLALDFAV